jgi:hypothetical protein
MARATHVSYEEARLIKESYLPRWWADLMTRSGFLFLRSSLSLRLLWMPEESGLFLPDRRGKAVMMVSSVCQYLECERWLGEGI